MHFAAPRPSGKSPLVLPPGNESFFYTVSRLCTFWPMINGNNATFFERRLAPLIEAGNESELGTIGKLANIWHSKGPLKGNKIIGSIKSQHYIPGVGIDVASRIDRKAASTYGITPRDFAEGGEYASCSQEMFCDRSQSEFIIMLDEEHASDVSKQKVLSAQEAQSLGVKRTYPNDPNPYYYDGKFRVVEACVPIRFTGIGFMDDPADPTAEVFELAASKGAKELPVENSGFAETDVPMLNDTAPVDVGADDPFQNLDHRYGDTESCELDDGERNQLPDHAFAATYTDTDGHAKIRKLPLYKTPEDVKAKKPTPGLVKAALEALTKGFRGERVHLPDHIHAEARNKVRKAHDELFPKGDHSEVSQTQTTETAATIDPKLEQEIASLRQQHDAAQSAKTNAEEQASKLNTQIDDLKVVITERDTEIASLKQAITDRDATELASKRLTELTSIDGFEVSEEEKSALLDSLKAESNADFTIRKQGIEIAMLKAGKTAKVETATELAARQEREAEETAAIRAGVDIIPTFEFKNGKATEIESII
jgi:hypothetical protein